MRSTYGNVTKLATALCSGTCKGAPGRYCPAGSASSQGVLCPQGAYCIGGAVQPLPCTSKVGYYCAAGSPNGTGVCCPPAYTCPGGAAWPCPGLCGPTAWFDARTLSATVPDGAPVTFWQDMSDGAYGSIGSVMDVEAANASSAPLFNASAMPGGGPGVVFNGAGGVLTSSNVVPADAAKTASGLTSKVLTPGTGKDKPGPEDKVSVHYTGWTTDGKMFDSSVTRGEPTSFRVNQVIKGWTEGLQLMTQGEKRRLWIPADLAYGKTPRMGAPAGDLVFDVELVSFTPAPKPPATPEDVKAAPASAKKTPSGLAYRILKKGTGDKAPKATDTVTVNYTGWTTDGKMFDSSVVRGEPTSFPLNHVIPGWTEGVQLMKAGETARFWIPANLAYGDKPSRPGAPTGMLVFDIELISIK